MQSQIMQSLPGCSKNLDFYFLGDRKPMDRGKGRKDLLSFKQEHPDICVDNGLKGDKVRSKEIKWKTIVRIHVKPDSGLDRMETAGVVEIAEFQIGTEGRAENSLKM